MKRDEQTLRRNTASISDETKKENSHRDASPGNTSILNGPLPYLFPFKLQYRSCCGLISLTRTPYGGFFVREFGGRFILGFFKCFPFIDVRYVETSALAQRESLFSCEDCF